MSCPAMSEIEEWRPYLSPDEAVTVVGAGLAGIACAIVLARAGRPAIVREWHKTVGNRFHGDFQGLENWSDGLDVLDELHAAGVETSFEAHPVLEGTAFDAWGNAYPIRGDRPLYYLMRRGGHDRSLEFALVKQAIGAGVEVWFGDRVANPVGSIVLAVGPGTADAIAAGYGFETDRPDGNWTAFSDRLAPLGYAYLLIHAGRGTVASCKFTGFKRQAEYVERTVAFFRDKAELKMRNPKPFGGFAKFRLPRTALQGGHPVVGDQAGFQDALADFGMRYALRSGILAADAAFDALKAGRSGDELVEYQSAYEASDIARELKLVRNVKPLLSKYGAFLGTLLGGIDMQITSLFGGWSPFGTLGHGKTDAASTELASKHKPIAYPKPDGKLSFDKLSSVFISNTNHDEDQPAHLKLLDPSVPIQVNLPKYGEPARLYCPAGVYEVLYDEDGKSNPRFQINAQNCVHCKTCDIKDPSQNIVWTTPQGGGGPNYPNM